MKLVQFQIENFKGIQDLTIEVLTKAPGNIVTLIGLNESGKTTILEAMSHFVSVDEQTSSIVKTVSAQQSLIDLLPMSKKGNFTGEISIRSEALLDEDDVNDLADHLRRRMGYYLIKDECPRTTRVRRVYRFKDGDHIQTQTLWQFTPKFLKKIGGRVYTAEGGTSDTREVWSLATDFVVARFPRIVYFPTFLFNVPERIYLEDLTDWEKAEDATVNNYFRQVLQDVADSLDDNLSIERHIVEKISRHREGMENDPFGFYQIFRKKDEKRSIDASVNRLAGAISRTVFSAWNRIFEQAVQDKSVKIDWDIDPERGNIPYLQLLIHDGEHDYSLHQRSLGFRWFFTFLLFTQFRRSRSNERGTIFLFDEPASNLHAQAQIKLLESFSKTAQGDQYIIYSTHSHYMIDPMTLEKAYIVENKAIDFENEDSGLRFSQKDTDVGVTRYRRFVADYPERVSYFQPALDALKFTFGPLVPGERAVIVEGKYDFHPLSYFQTRLEALKGVTVIPAPSASEAGTLISLLRGLGTRFIVMLDDDAEGQKSVKRYRDHHLLSAEQVITIADLDPKLKGKTFEALYSDEVKKLSGEYGASEKSSFSMLFQNLRLSGDYKVGLGQTTNRLKTIMMKLEERLGALPQPAAKKGPVRVKRTRKS
ncbi:MAG TPA: AAA family ATPase [Allosphingosinicella sp.]|uniref:ATP-dependent nuclease n=1 Tax=Allosphingosinicella sp. TaxID=2823234 RepID=UPI002ED934AF